MLSRRKWVLIQSCQRAAKTFLQRAEMSARRSLTISGGARWNFGRGRGRTRRRRRTKKKNRRGGNSRNRFEKKLWNFAKKGGLSLNDVFKNAATAQLRYLLMWSPIQAVLPSGLEVLSGAEKVPSSTLTLFAWVPDHQRWYAKWKLSRNNVRYTLHARFLHVWHWVVCSISAY